MSQSNANLPIAYVAVWSASDDPKVRPVVTYLQERGILVVDGVKSIHRTPHALEALAEELPDLPESLQRVFGHTKLRVGVVIWAAGGAAHLPGGLATHNPAIPVIALPVNSATFGQVFGAQFADINALESMHDMPPEVPNGLAANSAMAGRMAEKILKLDLPAGYNKVSLGEWVSADQAVLDSLGLEIDPASPVKIVLQDIGRPLALEDLETSVHVIIPTASPVGPGESRDIGTTLKLLDAEGLYMGWQAGKINPLNALVYAAQILASHGNDDIKDRLAARRRKVAEEVRKTDLEREQGHVARLGQIARLLESGLWPAGKTLDFNRGDERLESLGYVRFYTGKNADLYVIPDSAPLHILMVRSDRTSVFNIPLDLEIEGKGEIQNRISLLGAQFAENHGIPTAAKELPADIPAEIADRCQAIELCRPLEIEVGGEIQGMELIFRNFITGTLYGKYANGEDPYGISLPEGLAEWADIRDASWNAAFTPTDKSKDDNPIPSALVYAAHSNIVDRLRSLFREFTRFMYDRGYVVVDTKFEVFVDSNGVPVLGDEILTPESSRFIRREDFEAGRYVSADKQMIRNLGKQFGWEARWAEFKKADPRATRLSVAQDISDEHRAGVVKGYQGILEAMK